MVKGFKYDNGRIYCKDQTYMVGVPVKMDGPIVFGTKGFHYCNDLADVLDHYIPSKDHVYGRVRNLAPNESVMGNSVCCTPHIVLDELLDGPVTSSDGTVIYFKDGVIHNSEGPAIISPRSILLQFHIWNEFWNGYPYIDPDDRSYMWFHNGVACRHPETETETDHEPAFTTTNGIKAWFRENQLHRVGGPALIWNDGSQEWLRKGKRHRDGDLPALITTYTIEWWQDGNLTDRLVFL